jgi:DinB superfamily
VCPRTEITTSLPFGHGEFVSDFDLDPPDPPPFTTIAWRLCHIAIMEVLRHDHTFGSRTLDVHDVTLPATAGAAIHFIGDSTGLWRNAVAALDDARLDIVGLSQFPYGMDKSVPFGDLIWWMNLEFIHHSAEVACLRDLYIATGGASLNRAP